MESLVAFTLANAVGAKMEDRYLTDPEVPLLAVFDAETRVAAADMALDVLRSRREALRSASAASAARVFDDVAQAANRRIFEWARRDKRRQMGATTFTACTVADGQLVVVNVGDSRLYVARDQAWQRVTADHSLFEDPDYALSPSERAIATSDHDNVVTRVLGMNDCARPDAYLVPIDDVRAVLLCTDGAWRLFDPPGNSAILAFDGTVESVANSIVEVHTSSGACDDATVVAALL